MEELSELQDRLPPFSSTIAREVIREELGADPETLFAELSPEPVAAASLGQVYRGRLRTGEAVAVKVQRPGIGESIAVDMLLLRRLMQVVDSTLTPQVRGVGVGWGYWGGVIQFGRSGQELRGREVRLSRSRPLSVCLGPVIVSARTRPHPPTHRTRTLTTAAGHRAAADPPGG